MAEEVPRGLRSRLWLWLVVAVGVAAAGGSVYLASRSTSPLYEVKTSAEWFREFQKAEARQDTVARTYRRLYYKLPAPIKRLLPYRPALPDHLRMQIGWAFLAVGPDASALVPSQQSPP